MTAEHGEQSLESLIVAALTGNSADHPTADTDIASARRQVDLPQEYRTRLIADVVTGKPDVCEGGGAVAGGRR